MKISVSAYLIKSFVFANNKSNLKKITCCEVHRHMIVSCSLNFLSVKFEQVAMAGKMNYK